MQIRYAYIEDTYRYISIIETSFLKYQIFLIYVYCNHATAHGHSAPGHSAFGHSGPGHPGPRTSRSPDIQVPGHPGLSDIQVFRTSRSQDIQVPGHPGLLDIQVFRHQTCSNNLGSICQLNIYDIGYIMPMGDECKLEGFCVPFGHRVGECTISEMFICIGNMLPTIWGVCVS